MTSLCLLCKSNSCNGIACMKDYRNRCWKCLGVTLGTNYHRTIECLAYSISSGRCCPFCLLIFAPDTPAKTGLEHHQRGRCLYKDRIRRVLLYKVSPQRDKGLSTRNILQPCSRNSDVWFETMAKNLRQIEFELELTNNDDVDFLNTSYNK